MANGLPRVARHLGNFQVDHPPISQQLPHAEELDAQREEIDHDRQTKDEVDVRHLHR